MPAPKTQTRRDRKRLQTLNHLARTGAALFEAHGYEAVTMEQIAVEADVAKGTLYNHFPVKEALLAHWLHMDLAEHLTLLHAQLEKIPEFVEGAIHLLRHSAKWCEAHPEYLSQYLRFRFQAIGTQPSPSRDGEQMSDIADTFRWLIQRGQQSKEIRADLDLTRLTIAFHFLYLGAMLRWIVDPRLKLRKEFDSAVELFLHGAGLPQETLSIKSQSPTKRR